MDCELPFDQNCTPWGKSKDYMSPYIKKMVNRTPSQLHENNHYITSSSLWATPYTIFFATKLCHTAIEKGHSKNKCLLVRFLIWATETACVINLHSLTFQWFNLSLVFSHWRIASKRIKFHKGTLLPPQMILYQGWFGNLFLIAFQADWAVKEPLGCGPHMTESSISGLGLRLGGILAMIIWIA